MTINKLTLSLLGWWIFAFSTTLADQTQAEQARCIEQVGQAVKRLNVLLVSNHLPIMEFDPNNITIKSSYDRQRRLNFWKIRTPSHIYFDCLPKNCILVSVYRDFLYKNAPLYDSPPKPTWTPEQAIEKAKLWARAVLNDFPSDVGVPQVNFKPQMELPKYHDGEWEIRWPRVDSQGHSFDLDALHVHLSEKLGLVDVNLRFVSTFDEVQGKTISKEEAIEASHSPAETLLHGDLARPYLPSGLQLGNATASMWIMNPKDVFKSKTLTEMNTSEQTKARLAWVVVYPLMNGAAPVPDQNVEVWIDAQTKEVIGGDFH